MRSFSQIYIMAVWGVKYRLGLIEPSWRNELYGVIGNQLNKIAGVQCIAVGGYKDHVHVLFSTSGVTAESEIIREVKTESSRWVNSNKLTVGRFEWQDGVGKFSYSSSQVEDVKRYINNQEAHHKTESFADEYRRFLIRLGVELNQYSLPEGLL